MISFPHTTIPLTKSGIRTVPTTNGVYIFQSGDEPVYIGKSVNLKARLTSHLENASIDQKEASIIDHADSISYIITDSEFKALLLEAQLIRTYLPKYNVRWRDDKSYLYIKYTVKDEYPKFFITRREKDSRAVYFGPFSSVRTASRLLREIRKIFPFCTQQHVTKKACFYSKIGLCNPCPNKIEQVTDIVTKRAMKIKYRAQMRQAALILADKIEPVIASLQKQIHTLTKSERFEDAIPYRDRLRELEHIITGQHFNDDSDSINNSAEAQQSLISLLRTYFPLLNKLDRIECFDMSTSQFRDSTASMVVFTEGLSDKKQYRRFKIKNKAADSDFAMFKEVLRRRFAHKEWPHADLIIVDGGKPQVRTALQIIHECAISTPLIGIAKRPDRLVIGVENLPFVKPLRNHPGFLLVQSLRDESHRFAKKYHVHLRDKKMV